MIPLCLLLGTAERSALRNPARSAAPPPTLANITSSVAEMVSLYLAQDRKDEAAKYMRLHKKLNELNSGNLDDETKAIVEREVANQLIIMQQRLLVGTAYNRGGHGVFVKLQAQMAKNQQVDVYEGDASFVLWALALVSLGGALVFLGDQASLAMRASALEGEMLLSGGETVRSQKLHVCSFLTLHTLSREKKRRAFKARS